MSTINQLCKFSRKKKKEKKKTQKINFKPQKKENCIKI